MYDSKISMKCIFLCICGLLLITGVVSAYSPYDFAYNSAYDDAFYSDYDSSYDHNFAAPYATTYATAYAAAYDRTYAYWQTNEFTGSDAPYDMAYATSYAAAYAAFGTQNAFLDAYNAYDGSTEDGTAYAFYTVTLDAARNGAHAAQYDSLFGTQGAWEAKATDAAHGDIGFTNGPNDFVEGLLTELLNIPLTSEYAFVFPSAFDDAFAAAQDAYSSSHRSSHRSSGGNILSWILGKWQQSQQLVKKIMTKDTFNFHV